MLPILVHGPFHHPGWVYEEKVDGSRMLAYKNGGDVRLVSRRGRTTPVGIAARAVDARPRRRAGDLRRPASLPPSTWLRKRPTTERASPPVLIAFDLLYLKGRDISRQPLRKRRARPEARRPELLPRHHAGNGQQGPGWRGSTRRA